MTDEITQQPILEMHGISKEFGHVQALDNVEFSVLPSEILALVGDNGAGKSTLIKIASGVYQPDKGQITINGTPVTFQNPHVARDHGIATVYQDLALADDRDVASNLFLGREPTRFFMVDKQQMNTESRQILNRLRCTIPSVKTQVGLLSGGQRQAGAIISDLTSKVGEDLEATNAFSGRETPRAGPLRGMRVEAGDTIRISSGRSQETAMEGDKYCVDQGQHCSVVWVYGRPGGKPQGAWYPVAIFDYELEQ